MSKRPTAAGQEVALRRVRGKGDCRLVRLRRLGVTAEPPEEIGADGVEEVVALEIEGLDEGERRIRPFDLGQRDPRG